MDITSIPLDVCTGRIPTGLPTGFSSLARSILGMLGPVMSASRTPTS